MATRRSPAGGVPAEQFIPQLNSQCNSCQLNLCGGAENGRDTPDNSRAYQGQGGCDVRQGVGVRGCASCLALGFGAGVQVQGGKRGDCLLAGPLFRRSCTHEVAVQPRVNGKRGRGSQSRRRLPDDRVSGCGHSRTELPVLGAEQDLRPRKRTHAGCVASDCIPQQAARRCTEQPCRRYLCVRTAHADREPAAGPDGGEGFGRQSDGGSQKAMWRCSQ